MEIKEAIDFINEKIPIDVSLLTDEEVSRTVEVLNMAISALEKQKGKKPLPVSNGSTWSKCPVCGDTHIDEYCGKCGQRIDWSE